MTIIALVQSGTDGPIKLWAASDENAVRRAIARVQHGNMMPLLIRAVLDDPDGTLLDRLRHHLALWGGVDDHGEPMVADWYRPQALHELPGDVEHLPFDQDADETKLAAIRLEYLASRREPPT